MKILLTVDGGTFTKKMLAYVAAHDEWLSARQEILGSLLDNLQVGPARDSCHRGPGRSRGRAHICWIITCPNPEHDTCVAPSISRAKS